MATWADKQRAPKEGEKNEKGNPLLQKDYAPDGSGLKLRVFASGRRVWFIRGRVRRDGGEGASRFVQLGEYPGMTREDAEAAAAQARDLLRKGIDPNEQRDATMRATQASTRTFGEVVQEWTEDSKAEWRANT